MTKTIIGLLRHGQTNWNMELRLQGITDIPLNETGISQARLAGKMFAATTDNSNWDVVLTSPLSRARDTAAIVSEAMAVPTIKIEHLLLEQSFGEAEGLTHEIWREKYADPNRVPGGETLEQLETRVHRLLQHFLENYAGRKVLAVSHGALIRTLLRLVSEGEFPREGERLGNACLNIFEHTDDLGWRVALYEPRTIDEGIFAKKFN